MRTKTACLWALVLTGLAVLASPVRATGNSPGFSVTPDYVHIRETFRGEPITVSTEIPKGANVVVEMLGVAHEVQLLRQGRRGGLWMSVGEVTVKGAPSVYYLMTTSNAAGQSNAEPQWGYKALEKKTEFGGALPKGGSAELFQQFVKLKEEEGLYGIFPNSLKVAETSAGKSKVEGQLMLPSNIAPGNYRIVLSVLNSGKVLEQKTLQLPVEMKGLPGLLAALAYEHATFYGLIAVAIAILTGFIMGFLFKSKGAH